MNKKFNEKFPSFSIHSSGFSVYFISRLSFIFAIDGDKLFAIFFIYFFAVIFPPSGSGASSCYIANHYRNIYKDDDDDGNYPFTYYIIAICVVYMCTESISLRPFHSIFFLHFNILV